MDQEKHDKSKEILKSEEKIEDVPYREHSNFLAEKSNIRKKFIGSLSDQLANIGHIDSSETSDDSPEG